ncbi:MAG: NosD domain-containing protein, partial [Acidobacteriota bacterium]
GMHYWGGSEDNEVGDNAFIANQIQIKFVAARDQSWQGNFWSDYGGWDVDGDERGDVPYRSNTLVDALLWKYPLAKLLLTSPAFQALALAERQFPVITVPKVVDRLPWMSPPMEDWAFLLDRYPPRPSDYFGTLSKLPHLPGEHH